MTQALSLYQGSFSPAPVRRPRPVPTKRRIAREAYPRRQFDPGNDSTHLLQQLLATVLLAMLLEEFFRKRFLSHLRCPSSFDPKHTVIAHVET